MSYKSTGVNAILPEEAKMSCSDYYDDTTVLDFTSSGELAVINGPDTLYSTPLTDINFPIDDWATSSVKLDPASKDKSGNPKPYFINTDDIGTTWERRQLTTVETDFWEKEPKPYYCVFEIIDADGNSKATDMFDISHCTNMPEFLEALNKAINDKDFDLYDCEIINSETKEYSFVIRTCNAGVSNTYKFYFYDENKNLINEIFGEETRSAITYETPRASFIALIVTYGGESKSGSNGSNSCGCSKGCGCGGNGSTSDSSSDGNNANTQNVLKWTSKDLYNRFAGTEDEHLIWDNLSKILIHSGAQNTNEDDDLQIRPLVLINPNNVVATVKIILAN